MPGPSGSRTGRTAQCRMATFAETRVGDRLAIVCVTSAGRQRTGASALDETIADTMPRRPSGYRRLVLTLAWLALAAAVVSFAVRGVARGAVDSGDLAVGYAAAKAWIAGDDP